MKVVRPAHIDAFTLFRVDPEDLRKHGDKAMRLARDLSPGESVRWVWERDAESARRLAASLREKPGTGEPGGTA